MPVGTVIGSAVLLLIGAAVGFVPTFLIERSKQRHALKTRWDVPLFELSKGFTGATRRLVHLALRLDRAADQEDQLAKIDEIHAELRALSEQMRLLGSAQVQDAARVVVHHCYAVRAVAEGKPDKRLKDYPGTTPVGRVQQAIKEFLAAVRKQLGVADPDDVTGDVVLPDEPWHAERPDVTP